MLFVLLFVSLSSVSAQDSNITQINAELYAEYNYSVDFFQEYLFKYKYRDSQLNQGALRIFVESEDSDSARPVLVVVRHEKGVLSWQLPLLAQRNDDRDVFSEYRTVNRTLCPLDDYLQSGYQFTDKELDLDMRSLDMFDDEYLSISITTASPKPTGFKLILYIQKDYKVGMNETRRFEVTPSAPQYFEFNFPTEVDIAMISVDSPDRLCMTISVQNMSCPVSDLDRNVDVFEGIWQTVDSKTGVTIRRELFPSGLHIVFVVKPDDNDCRSYNSLAHHSCDGPCRIKTVEFSISSKITKNEYLAATFGAFAMFMGAYFLVITVSCLICVRKRRVPVERSLFDPQNEIPSFSRSGSIRTRYGSLSSSGSSISGQSAPRSRKERELPVVNHHHQRVPTSANPTSLAKPSRTPSRSPPDGINVDRPDSDLEDQLSARTSSPDPEEEKDPQRNIWTMEGPEESEIDMAEYDMLHDADLDKDVFRTKTFLFVSDLARKHPKVLARRAMLYQWNLLTISIFYGLPVVQLVVTYQNVLHQTGNEDLCYYNFLCSHPLGLLSDFNHVFSNIGYVMLGGLFMVFVWRREYMYNIQCAENPRWDRMYGVPQHSGLFYAMGLALVMEGLMSGCYHICPNHSNFQFDTAFMYTIAILAMLKIYQFRHPDIHANAYTAFGVLAFVILIGMLGVTQSSIPFWIFFTGCHVITCFIVSIQIYFMGRWKVDGGLVKRIYQMIVHDLSSLFTGAWYGLKPTYPDRMVLLVIFNFINWGLSIYGVLVMAQRDADFAGFLLGVFIINLLLYCAFYILMKLRHGERICRQSLTYSLLACLCCAPAMYFFLNKNTTWNMKPAQSRHYNQECKLFHFYDNHDIWHFLSATALFFAFMAMLTIDDDISEKPRDKIPVF